VSSLERGRGVPRWYHEGLADHVSYAALGDSFPRYTAMLRASQRSQMAQAHVTGTRVSLTRLSNHFGFESFASQGRGHAGQAYAESATAIERLAQRHGMPAVVRAVTEVGAGKPWPEAFRTAFGQTPEAFAEEHLATRP